MSGADVPDLHPVELGYLKGGVELAVLVACIGLHERGILVRSASGLGGLGRVAADDPDCHPVERAVVTAVGTGVTGPGLAEALRTVAPMIAVRDRLVRQGLLTHRLGREARSRAGRATLAAAAGGAVADAPATAARQVAVFGPEEIPVVAPALARALGALPRRRTVRRPKADAVVSRSVRRGASNNRRMAVGSGNNSDTTSRDGGAAGASGAHGHMP